MSSSDSFIEQIDKSWTLFLDRDGVINKKLPGDYVKSWEAFNFNTGVLEAIPIFNSIFGRIIVVTNQQGIGLNLMRERDLYEIHEKMLFHINENGGRIHQIYYCPELAIYNPIDRKPNPGMGLKAKEEFPSINFRKSVMVGDSESDILFGNKLGMKTILISSIRSKLDDSMATTNMNVSSLMEFAEHLIK